MNVIRRPSLSFPLALILAAFLYAGCSNDSSDLVGPDPPEEPTTPDIPTVTNPQDELPPTSDFLTVESAGLRNLSPNLAGLSPATQDKLNEAIVIDFQLPPSRNVIYEEGHACYPEHLQFRSTGAWANLTRATAPAPFTDLGSFEGSYYYLSASTCDWAYADVSCRNFGGQMASVSSAAENAFLLGAVQNARPGASYFLGLTDWDVANNSWYWTSGEPVVWTNWNSGEPNNYHGEYFVQVLTNGLWNDTRFGYRYPYVLESDVPLPELVEEIAPCAAHGPNTMFLDGMAAPTVAPHVERRLYWARVFQVTLGAGATYSQVHTYKHGTSETTGMSFGWSIGISTEIGWGPVSTQIETEFHQDFNREVTISSEEEFSKTYEATAPADKVMVLALWQLRECFVITDESGQDWADPAYVLDGPLPYLDQGLQQEYLQTILFDTQ